MKQEFDNSFSNDNFSDWGNPYNNSTTENQNTSSATTNQYSNSYGNNQAPNQFGNQMPNNQYANAYSNQMPYNQYDNTYGNQIPNNQYGNPPIPNQYYGMPNQYNVGQLQPPKKRSKKSIVLIVVLAVVLPLVAIGGFIALIFGIVTGALNRVKDSEEYALAYSYLINSVAFDNLDVDESEIKFTGYEKTIKPGSSHGDRVELTFFVDGSSFTVVCHQENDGEWFVCDECTFFD